MEQRKERDSGVFRSGAVVIEMVVVMAVVVDAVIVPDGDVHCSAERSSDGKGDVAIAASTFPTRCYYGSRSWTDDAADI